jgi:hypothetical protein
MKKAMSFVISSFLLHSSTIFSTIYKDSSDISLIWTENQLNLHNFIPTTIHYSKKIVGKLSRKVKKYG